MEKRKNMNISSFLMDQDIFAGIGNYIRNESLYLSKINPKTKNKTILDNDDSGEIVKDLYDNILFVAFSNLKTWFIEKRIHIPKQLEEKFPHNLQVPYVFNVYKKDKDQKGNNITEETTSGRKTYYVKSIQTI